jgi:GDP-mannose 6-dehydrogenase
LHVNVESPLFITDFKTAEFAKYIDNSFHALKVAYSNEVFGLGAELGVNISDSHKIFIADNKLNISHRYLKPGTPFGGSCLPKDLRELQHLKNKSSRKFSILESIIPSNENFITYIINTSTSFNKNKISFIGITFKNDSDDLRESPILKILLELKQKSVDYSFNIFDEDLNADNVRIDFPYLYSGILNLESCVENGEILVVTKRYFEQTKKLKKANQILLNLSDIVNADLKDNIYNIYCP